MSAPHLAIINTGLVSSVGLTAPASCAAIRAKVSNANETRFVGSDGEWIMAHSVLLGKPWLGRAKLVQMAVLVIEECLTDVPQHNWTQIPLMLCIAERDRPGRLEGLDDELLLEIQSELGIEFAKQSLILPYGRVGASTALMRTRALLRDASVPYSLIVAVDSFVHWPTLVEYERQGRLLASNNSNGFLPGEGAGALLVGPSQNGQQLLCAGLGFATETATIEAEQPLRGEGMAKAIKGALAEAECEFTDLDFRITDLSGEQYYFKEAALGLSRILRVRKELFDIWQPAECVGEVGAVSGVITMAVANAAYRKSYAPGPRVLCHAANDDGLRSAAVLQYRDI
jgi:3-oxoacyl-[acyl-carrier-protein] synthase I